MESYRALMHPDAWSKAGEYLAVLRREGVGTAGSYLQRVLQTADLSSLSPEQFVEDLVATKRPRIFAEREVYGDGTDWNATELSILGDIGFAVGVTVYDDGRHAEPRVHETPFPGTLLFTPGALLRNDTGRTPADWNEVTQGATLDPARYRVLCERRLLPLLLFANDQAEAEGKRALITVPGLGCGQFAGPFRGQLGEALKNALIALLCRHAEALPRVTAVYYDPYDECLNERHALGSVDLLVRPLLRGNQHKPQLCPPRRYEDVGDDFADSRLFSVVAWDHVSWPGNDFYGGARVTDDGVKAAATSSMTAITGVEGRYDARHNTFDPPQPYRTWEEVVLSKRLRLVVDGNLSVLPARDSTGCRK